MKIRLSLRRKLLLAFAVVLLPVLVLLVVDFESTRRSTRDTILQEQLLTAQSIAVHTDEAFDAALGIAWAVANDPYGGTMNPNLLDPHLQRLVRQQSVYEAILVFDPQGRNRGWGQVGMPPEPRLDVSNRDYFKTVMSTNDQVISHVLLLQRPAVVGVVAAVPVRDEAGGAIGVVAVAIRTDQLAARHKESALREGQAIFLADPTGRLAFHTSVPDLSYEQTDAFSETVALRQALAGENVLIPNYISPIIGDERLGAFVPTRQYGWAVGVTIPVAQALQIAQDSLSRRLIGFLVIMLFTSTLAITLAELLANPVRRLRDSVRALGRGELGRRVVVRTGDEIEVLADSFNEMAGQLQQRQDEVLRLSAEAQVRAAQLEAVIASMTEAVFIASPDRRLLRLNPAARRLLGVDVLSPAEGTLSALIQNHQPRLLDGTLLNEEDFPLARALDGETFSDVEMSIRTRHGQERIIRVSGSPVRDEGGKTGLAVVVARDVSDERRRQQEREAIAEIARSLVTELELAKVAEVVLQQSLRVLGADAVELHLAEPAHQELILLAHSHPQEAQYSVDPAARLSYGSGSVAASVARTGTVRIEDDLLQVAEEFPLSNYVARREGLRSLLAMPLHSRGQLVGVATLLSHRPKAFSVDDIGFHATIADLFAVAIENANLYSEVRDALRLREEFISSAAHELKTPVTVIKGWAQFLMATDSLSPQQRKALETIDRQADRVSAFTEDLLSAAEIGRSVEEMVSERVDLSLLVRTIAGQIGTDLDGHPLVVHSDTPLHVMGDSQLLAEVVRRLLENAARYSAAGSDIQIETRPAGGQGIVSISDHGAGIAVDRQPYVFEPFYQPIPPGVPGYVGEVSLGLHLSKRIVETLGGHLWFVSVPGEGSTFYFSLPLV